jgi:flagellar basal body-associated protein FliL
LNDHHTVNRHMNKRIILAIVFAGVLLIGAMVGTGWYSLQKSKDILNEFNKVNESLGSRNKQDSAEGSTRADSFMKEFEKKLNNEK